MVVFEEQADGTFKAYHRDMDCYCEGQYKYSRPMSEQPIFLAATMRECVRKFEAWEKKLNEDLVLIEYGYVFELRAGNEANPS